jgi:hypothetical protein
LNSPLLMMQNEAGRWAASTSSVSPWAHVREQLRFFFQ